MSSPVLIEQLDSAIDVLLSDPDAAIPNVDATVADLLGVAAELRTLPRPDFRSQLKYELTQVAGRPLAASQPDLQVLDEMVCLTPPVNKPRSSETILPTLFGEGYGTYAVRRSNFAASVAAHAVVLALVLASGVIFTRPGVKESAARLAEQEISVYVPVTPSAAASHGGGGGGDRDVVRAPEGRLPKTAMEQITPPEVVVRNDHAKLTVDPTVVMPPQIKISSNLPNLGDPSSSIVGPPSNGTGSGGGFGTGNDGGVGSGNGGGVGAGLGGGYGGGVFRVGGGVSAPRVIYKLDPEYSTEARQAKYQGTVVLSVIVDADGHTRHVQVARSLGMGLDEKAVEAVRQWRFEPARKDGRPVPVMVDVEVAFRLF
jgi:TonB family protein